MTLLMLMVLMSMSLGFFSSACRYSEASRAAEEAEFALVETRDEARRAKGESERARERMREVEESATRLEKEKTDMEKQLVEYMTSAPMPTEVERLQSEVEKIKKTEEEMERLAKEKGEEAEELKARLEAALKEGREEKERLESTLKEVYEEKELLEASLGEKQEAVLTLQTKLKEEEESSKLDEELVVVRKQLEELEVAKESEKIDLDQRWSEAYYGVVAAAEEAQKSAAEWKKEAEEKGAEVEELKTEVTRVAELEAKLEESAEAFAKLEASMKAAVRDEDRQEQRVLELKIALEARDAETEELRGINELVGREKAALEERLATLAGSYEEMKSTVARLQQQEEGKVDAELYAEVKAKLVESNIERTRLRMELDSAREEEEAKAREALATSSQDYQDFQELNRNLQVEIQSLKEDLQRQRAANESMQAQRQGSPTGGATDAQQQQQVQQQLQHLVQQQQAQMQQTHQQLALERQLMQQLESDLQLKDAALKKAEEELESIKSPSGAAAASAASLSFSTPARRATPPRQQPHRQRTFSETSSGHEELARLFSSPLSEDRLVYENDRLRQDLDKTMRENRHLTSQVGSTSTTRWSRLGSALIATWRFPSPFFFQMESWKQQLTDISRTETDLDSEEENPDAPRVLRAKQAQAWRSVGALQLRVEQLTLEVTKLLEERDTLQLKLSNVMRQYERQKESSSRASTACSTPIPWVDNTMEIKELRSKSVQKF